MTFQDASPVSCTHAAAFPFAAMLTACTYLSAVCEAGAPGAQLQAYKKIIDLADVVLCVYDTDIPATSSAEDRALAYAEGQHKSLVLLHPTELTIKQISAAHDAR